MVHDESLREERRREGKEERNHGEQGGRGHRCGEGELCGECLRWQSIPFPGLTPAHPETFLKRVIPHLPQDAAEVLFVMEATGVYSLKLALFLVQGGHRVSVVNPFVVRKYAEMRLRRTKTDPADSRILAQFGFFASPSPFHPQEEKAYHLRQVLKAIDDYQKRRTEILNHLETLKHHPFPQPKVRQYYEQELQRVEETLQALEREAEDLALQYAPREYELLLSIPGVGRRLACAILGILSPLTRFRNGKELASFLGLAPQIDQSGKRKERAWMKKGESLPAEAPLSFRPQCFPVQRAVQGAL
jgi:transposase